MKNSASELFLLTGKQEGEMAYQLTFGYVRMLAILLRKGVKEGSKVSCVSQKVTEDCIDFVGANYRTLSNRYTIGSSYMLLTSGHWSCLLRARRIEWRNMVKVHFSN